MRGGIRLAIHVITNPAFGIWSDFDGGADMSTSPGNQGNYCQDNDDGDWCPDCLKLGKYTWREKDFSEGRSNWTLYKCPSYKLHENPNHR